MSGGPLQDLHSHRGVGPGVADHPHPQGHQVAIGVTSGAVRHADRVPLRVHEKRLLTGERAPDRPAEEVRCQCSLCLVGHVFLAAEGATVADQLSGDQIAVDAEHGGDLVAVVPYALAAGPDVQAPIFCGCSHGGFGFDEGVFNALGLEHLIHDVCGHCQGHLNLSSRVTGHGEDVPVEAPHRVIVCCRRQDGVGEHVEGVVVDFNQCGCPAGGLPVVSDHDGQYVAKVGGAPSLGDEHRPVGVDDPHP